MAIIINPGSHIGEENGAKGWTNSHTKAAEYAVEWFDNMKDQGFVDIIMEDTEEDDGSGRWLFKFHHTVTGKTVELYTHGIDDLNAYEAQCIFSPRVYWDGSSSSNPELDDFAVDGFEPVMTYRKKPGVGHNMIKNSPEVNNRVLESSEGSRLTSKGESET